MNVLICPHCGKENPADAEFCESCLTPMMYGLPKKDTGSAEDSPEWLKKIREKNKEENTGTPPLGEFGKAEERPFGGDAVPGEIPDWLKEIQKSEPPRPPEPVEPESDWVSRLHDILPESDRQALRSTGFFSQEELAAMAAASRKLEPADFEPPEKATTQPLNVDSDSTPTDFTISSSAFQEPPADLKPPAKPEYQPESSREYPEEITGSHSQDEIQVVPEKRPSDSEPAKQREEKMEKTPSFPHGVSPQESKVESGVSLIGEIIPESHPLEPLEETAAVQVSPVISDEQTTTGISQEMPAAVPSGDMGQTSSREEDTSPEKPEELVPESVLQPQYNRAVEYSGRLELTESQRIRITQLKNMLVGEIQPQTPLEGKSRISGRTLRLVIGIIIILAMLFPLLTGYVLTGQQSLFSPGVVAMHKAIAGLPENAPFLVITDYEPAFSSELKAASNGVVENLMMKGMNLTILSTIPAGPALAHDLITSIRSGIVAYPAEKIAFLGYLPGGTTGLRDFVRAPRQAMPLLENASYAWTYPASRDVNTIQDYAGILILTENTEIGRAWIEQLHGEMADRPLLMVVSAQSAPLMRPYLDSDQLNGLIGGRVEGAMYDRIMEFPPRTTNVTAAYQIGMLIAAALTFLGGLFGIIQGLFTRRTSSSREDWHVG